MSKPTYSFTIDEQVMEGIEILAEDQFKSGRMTSRYVESILRQHTDKNKNRISKLKNKKGK